MSQSTYSGLYVKFFTTEITEHTETKPTLTGRIIRAAIDVHRLLGLGSVYTNTVQNLNFLCVLCDLCGEKII